MVLIVIGIIILGFGFFFTGLCYEPPKKSKKKFPDHVVMADDGDDK